MPPTLHLHLDPTASGGVATDDPARWPATALFLDVAGFTPLTSALQRFGPKGLEELQQILNGFFGEVDREIHGAGGVVVRYEGDAVVALFDAGVDGATNALATAERLIALTRDFTAIDTVAGLQGVRAKIGISNGDVESVALTRGDRRAIVVGGAGVDEAADAEHLAEPGDIIVSTSVLADLDVDDPGVAAGEDCVRWRVGALGGAPPGARTAPAPVPPTVEPGVLLHPAVIGRLELGEDVASDFRIVTIVFIGLQGDDAGSVSRLGPITDRLHAVAASADAELLAIQTGDKGTNAIVAVGAPAAVDDTPTRALVIADALLSDEAVPCRIGVSTGALLAGPLGGSIRSDYTVLGNAVNMAARLMTRAAPRQALIDDRTATQSTENMEFSDPVDLMVKGRVEPLRVRSLDGGGSAPSLTGASTLALVGRNEDLTVLGEHWLRTTNGSGGIVHVIGDGGVGKTRLIEDFIRTNDLDPVGVVFPRFRRAAGLEPLIPMFRTLLGLADDRRPDGAAVALLADRAGFDSTRIRYLSRLLGAEAGDDDIEPSAKDAELLRALAIDVVRLRASRGPVAIVVDGVEGISDESRLLFEDLARAAIEQPVLIISASRPSDRLTELHGLGTTIELASLPKDDAERLASLAGADDPAALVAAVGANPLAIRLAASSGSATIDDSTDHDQRLRLLAAAQVDSVSEPAANWLREVSVLGDDVDEEISSLAFGAPPTSELIDRGLLLADLDARSTRFASGLIHEVAYEGILPTRRSRLHHAAGDAMEQILAIDADRVSPAAIAHQFANTEDIERQVVAFRRAGQAAADAFSLLDATHWFEQLLPLVEGAERSDVALSLGQWHVILGDLARAEEAFKIATDDRNGVRARALAGLGGVHRLRGEHEAATPILAEAERLARSLSDDRALADVLLQRADVTWGARRPAELDELVAEMQRLAPTIGDEMLAKAEHAAGTAVFQLQQDGPASRRLLQSALDRAGALNDPLMMAEIRSDLAGSFYVEDRLFDALDQIMAAVGEANRIGYRRGVAGMLGNESQLRFKLGDIDGSMRCAHGSLQQLAEIGDLLFALNGLSRAGIAFSAIGQVDIARPLLEGVAMIAQDREQALTEVFTRHHLARLRLAESDPAGAEAERRRYVELAGQIGFDGLAFDDLVLEARLAEVVEGPNAALQILEGAGSELGHPADLAYEKWRVDSTPDRARAAKSALEELHRNAPTAHSARRLAAVTNETVPLPDVATSELTDQTPGAAFFLSQLEALRRSTVDSVRVDRS